MKDNDIGAKAEVSQTKYKLICIWR